MFAEQKTSDSQSSVLWASLVALVVKKPPPNAGDTRDVGFLSPWVETQEMWGSCPPGLRRSPGEGNGNSHEYSRLENSMDRGAWRATVHGATKSWTQLKQLRTQIQ